MKHLASNPNMADSSDNPPAPETRPLGMSRNVSMPVITTDTSYLKPPTGLGERRGSFDAGWLSRSVRRFSTGSTEALPMSAEAMPKNSGNNKESNVGDNKSFTVGDHKPANDLLAPPTNAGMGQRRKSESAIWKWFNTPLNSEAQHNIRGVVITEEQSEISIPAHVQNIKMPSRDESDGIVNTKKFSAMKDLNALSPTQW